MAAVSVKINRIYKNRAGNIVLSYDDGNAIEFHSKDASELFELTTMDVIKLAVLLAISKGATFNQIATYAAGKTITVDPGAATAGGRFTVS